MPCRQEPIDRCYHEKCLALEAERLLQANPDATLRLDCFSRKEYELTKSFIAEELRPRVYGTWLT